MKASPRAFFLWIAISCACVLAGVSTVWLVKPFQSNVFELVDNGFWAWRPRYHIKTILPVEDGMKWQGGFRAPANEGFTLVIVPVASEHCNDDLKGLVARMRIEVTCSGRTVGSTKVGDWHTESSRFGIRFWHTGLRDMKLVRSENYHVSVIIDGTSGGVCRVSLEVEGGGWDG